MFLDIVKSEKFGQLCHVLFENFEGMKADKVFDISLVHSRMKDGSYEGSSLLFHSDIQQEGKYSEALGKWESALLLMPDRAILHEQKAQILLELGETWKALKAATRATELEPSWGETWVTLGRAQLNYGEPDSAIESLDRALAIKPDSVEARNDRQAALHHIQRRKQLQTSGLSMNQNRFAVVDKTESA
ncbi:uncharacterized protein LOC132627185 isoform X1 [Lycium barbarum]|uniref:uncharacterized protein LOC132627185 isoform X1 n=1 Tax=Lycium barbarum TaxID=112863 RepID=UPI00293E4904|nr:uncharacterized protein LOC132627185 isoform X1 [Lycium barbarum]XP_060198359.1 uncharacterized protein LOC132627185 isoform X1 [Lycium barbarum]